MNPGRSDWQRRRQVRMIMLAVLVALVSGAMVAGLILFTAAKK
jgi:hypothetical protein